MAKFCRNILLITLCTLLPCSLTSNAQNTLQWQLISSDLPKALGIDTHLGDLAFANNPTGFITAKGGGVLRTDDGGINWRVLFNWSGFGRYIFFDPTTWFAYAQLRGNAYGRTTDAGADWQTSDHATDPCLGVHFSFLTPLVGWVVTPSSVCTTQDGGLTWSVIAKSPNLNPHTIFMLDNAHGWMAGKGSIFVTADNGAHWASELQDPNIDARDVRFLDQNIGYALADVRVPVTGAAATADSGTVFAYSSTLLYTQDGGSHWVQSTWKISGSDGFTTNYVIRGNSDVWIIGGFDQSGATSGSSTLFHSRNGGVSFDSAFPVPSYLSSPNIIALLTQNGTSTLLVLDASGALARTVLPTN